MDEVRGFNQNSSHSWGWKTLGANSDLEKEMLSWAREAGFAFEELECLMNSFSIVTNNYNTMYNGTRYPSPMVLAAIFLSISTLECVSSLSCSLFLLLGLLHIMVVTKRTSPNHIVEISWGPTSATAGAVGTQLWAHHNFPSSWKVWFQSESPTLQWTKSHLPCGWQSQALISKLCDSP